MSKIFENYSLLDHNTFSIDASARFFMEANCLDDIKEGLEFAKDKNLPFFILGGGSNILLLDNLEKFVLKNSLKGIEITSESGQDLIVKVMGGVVWHDLVLWSVERGYGGLENLSLIPGTVGASPIQNIGAYGVEIKDIFSSLEAVNLETLEVETFDSKSCVFGYRNSVFKNALKGKYFISSVSFKLTKTNHAFKLEYGPLQALKQQNNLTPKIISETVISIRNSKLPNPDDIPNSGSFFKNPIISLEVFENLKAKCSDIPVYPVNEDSVKIPAAWLIDQAGWKGFKNDKVGVFEKQALVLINHNQGRGEDIQALSNEIIKDVESKFNIVLEPEVNFIS